MQGMETAFYELLQSSPVLLVVFIIGRWLGKRIDRVLDLHERMLDRLLDLVDPVAALASADRKTPPPSE